MKKIFKRLAAAFTAAAVALTMCFVFDLPAKLSVAAAAQNCDGVHSGMTEVTSGSDLSSTMTSGKYYLGGDISFGGVRSINSGVDVTICLNGHNISTTATGYTIFEVDGGSLTICDCKGNGNVGNNTKLNTATQGGSVYVGNNGSFTMCGGKISGNTKGNEYGGGVYVYNGTFEMTGGTISGNTATKSGGGVYVYNGTFKMSGGTISDNNADTGGGVDIGSSTFTMNGGTISGNTAGFGGGVYVGSGTFTMSGGTISGNSSNNNGGGVYQGDTFIINGNVEIQNNTKSTDNSANNVSLASGKTIGIESGFSTAVPIGIYSLKKPTSCAAPVAVTEIYNSDISASFRSDRDGFDIIYKDGKVQLTAPHEYGTAWSKDADDHWHECSVCSDKKDVEAHTWNSGAVTKPTTCTAAGTKKYTCTACNQTKTETVAATGHDYGSWTITEEPTLTETGVAERVCANDTTHKETESLPNLADNSVWTKDESQHIDPTEENTGKDVYTSVYGEVERTIPATGHTLTHVDEVPATENTEGVKEHWHCDGCGKDFADENGTTELTDLKIPVIGHTHTLTHVDEVPATETTEGTKEHWHCEGCGKDFEDENGTTELTDLKIPVLEHTHTLTHVDEVPATETTEGVKEHWHCDGCGKDFADENGTTELTDVKIPAIGHTHTLTHVDEVPATETTEGTKEHWHCNGCGKNFADANGTTELTDVKIPVIGHTHTLTHIPEVPATETTEGVKEHWHCEGCGKDFADEDGTSELTDLKIPVIGHTHTLTHVDEVPATETTEGVKAHWHCNGCGKDFADENGTTELTDLKIPVLEHTHTLTHVDEVPATETTEGVKEHWHCNGCGKDFADKNGTIEMTGSDLKIPFIKTEVTVGNSAPQVTVNEKQLIEAVIGEDKAENGVEVKIIVKVDIAGDNADKTVAEETVKTMDNFKMGQYIDISLILEATGKDREFIHEIKKPITITIEIPANLLGKSEYKVIRVHDGVTDILPDLDKNDNTVTIETDRFSTYALVYKEKSGTSGSGNSSSGSSGSRPSGSHTGSSGNRPSDSTSDNNASENNEISEPTPSVTETADSSEPSSESGETDTVESGEASAEGGDETSDNATSLDSENTFEGTDDTDESSAPSTNENNSASSESGSFEDNENPATGIAVSIIPIGISLAILSVAVKRKKK